MMLNVRRFFETSGYQNLHQICISGFQCERLKPGYWRIEIASQPSSAWQPRVFRAILKQSHNQSVLWLS